MTLPAPLRAAIRERLAGTPLVLLLDVDGTLAPLTQRPEEARVHDSTRGMLADLAAMHGVHVAFVSGRAAEDAQRLVGMDGTWVIGNHGCERLTPDGVLEVPPDAARYLEPMAAAAAALEPLVAPVAGAFVENKIRTLSVHYRMAEASAVPALREHVAAVAGRGGLRVMEGKCIIEVRPPVAIDKGTATEALARELGVSPGSGSLLYAGDDVSDEDAFRRLRADLPRVVTVRIGDDPAMPTAAEFLVRDPDAVSDLLAAIAAQRRGP